MALWPNNFTDIRGRFPVTLQGSASFLLVQQRVQRQLAWFANEGIEETSSIPEGSFESRVCIRPPLVSGAMSSGNRTGDITVAGSGNVLAGGPMAGTADVVFSSPGANLSLIMGLSGTADITFGSPGANLSLTIGLSGESTINFAADAGLGLIIPMSGAAAISVTGAANLKGRLSMSGESKPFTELSPQSLAAAVWSAVAASSDAAGSMGEKLNDAGSASNPWTEVIESGYTAAQILKLLAAVAAGKSSGAGTPNMSFTGLDGTTVRVSGTQDASKNRTTVVLNAT